MTDQKTVRKHYGQIDWWAFNILTTRDAWNVPHYKILIKLSNLKCDYKQAKLFSKAVINNFGF